MNQPFPILPPPEGPKVIEGAAKGALWAAVLGGLLSLFRTGNDDYKRRFRGL